MRALICFALLSVSIVAVHAVAGEPATTVFLNGVPASVHFNDGDSFRVLSGEYANTKARLAGFNTLESYGGVHQWGEWTPAELYINAKMGTLNARRGTWHCTGDPADRDGYGRILWECPDLREDQVRKGFAHVLTVTAEGGDPASVAAQQEAIKARRGMWAHGVPSFVLTSLHSASEGGGSDGVTYNRLASTVDGHSEKWIHNDNYAECETVCFKVHRLSQETIDTLVAAAKEGLPETFAELSDAELARRVQNTIDIGHVGWMETKALSVELSDHLKGVLKKTPYTVDAVEDGACMVYVDFKRRYGSRRASCLNK